MNDLVINNLNVSFGNMVRIACAVLSGLVFIAVQMLFFAVMPRHLAREPQLFCDRGRGVSWTIERAYGIERVSILFLGPDGIGEIVARSRGVEAELPVWCRWATGEVGQIASAVPLSSVSVVRAGLPFSFIYACDPNDRLDRAAWFAVQGLSLRVNGSTTYSAGINIVGASLNVAVCGVVAVGVMMIELSVKRIVRRMRGGCMGCGYPLEGLLCDECPECGRACRD